MIDVVGIGADGWAGLGDPARARLRDAEVLLGSERQLELVPSDVPAARIAWPSPMLPAIAGLLQQHAAQRVCVLASGDPMVHGIGGTLGRIVGPDRLRVLPQVSSVALACARLGWPLDSVEVVSVVARPLELVVRAFAPGRRVVVLGSDGGTPGAVAALLTAHGYGDSRVTALSRLGGPDETATGAAARDLPAAESDPLTVTAVECCAEPAGAALSTGGGLPDDAFEHDGQITKRDVRAAAIARLVPLPGQLLWDVGAGSGSVAVEWMRHHPSCRGVAVEQRADRAARVARNAARLGVPGLEVVTGAAPAALRGLPPPDAVFVGGGTVTGVLDECWEALRPGGRMVAHGVTLESESLLAQWHGREGGELIRISVQRAEPLGGFTGWRPSMPVTQWSVTRA